MKRFDSLESLVKYLDGTKYTLKYLEDEVCNYLGKRTEPSLFQ